MVRKRYINQRPASSFEPTGKCLYCKGALPSKRHKKYCSVRCSDRFYDEEVKPYILDWNLLRKTAKRRDKHKCVKCGARRKLQVDHIKPIHRGGEEFNLENLQTLCIVCHKIKTQGDISFKKV